MEKSNKKQGYMKKYVICKADGSDMDPNADYFVLRLDKDKNARKALAEYARDIRSGNEELYQDIMMRLSSLYDTDEYPISSGNYVKNVLRTEPLDLEPIKKRLNSDKVIRLLHASMGMSTESGELMDMLKKHIFYGKPVDNVNAKEEIGDNLWYVGLAIDVMKTTMNEIMSLNIGKLKKRYPEKFCEEKALKRDIENELSDF